MTLNRIRSKSNCNGAASLLFQREEAGSQLTVAPKSLSGSHFWIKQDLKDGFIDDWGALVHLRCTRPSHLVGGGVSSNSNPRFTHVPLR
jgi:hypothetical protein